MIIWHPIRVQSEVRLTKGVQLVTRPKYALNLCLVVSFRSLMLHVGEDYVCAVQGQFVTIQCDGCIVVGEKLVSGIQRAAFIR